MLLTVHTLCYTVMYSILIGFLLTAAEHSTPIYWRKVPCSVSLLCTTARFATLERLTNHKVPE